MRQEFWAAPRAPGSLLRNGRRAAGVVRHTGEPKGGKDFRRAEHGERRDGAIVEREHMNGVRPPFKALPVASIDGEGRLCIGSGANETESSVRVPGPTEENSDRAAAAVPFT